MRQPRANEPIKPTRENRFSRKSTDGWNALQCEGSALESLVRGGSSLLRLNHHHIMRVCPGRQVAA